MREDWLSPGAAEVVGEFAGEHELGVGGGDQPCPVVGCERRRDVRCRPAERLFQEPERVFQIEATQVGLPVAVDVLGIHLCGRGP